MTLTPWNCLIFTCVFAAELVAAIRWTSAYWPVRWFLLLCAALDLVTISHRWLGFTYWDVRWYSEQVELALLALIAGYVCTIREPQTWKTRVLQLLWAPMPAIAVFRLSLSFSPLTSWPEEMHLYRAIAGGIISLTAAIGAWGLLKQMDRRIALAVGMLGVPAMAGSGLAFALNVPASITPALWIAALMSIPLICRSGTRSFDDQQPSAHAGPR